MHERESKTNFDMPFLLLLFTRMNEWSPKCEYFRVECVSDYLSFSLSLSFSLVIDAKGPGASKGREQSRRGRTGAALDSDAEGDQGRARLLGGGPRRGRLARTGAGADGRGDGGGDGRGLARSSGGRWCFFLLVEGEEGGEKEGR